MEYQVGENSQSNAANILSYPLFQQILSSEEIMEEEQHCRNLDNAKQSSLSTGNAFPNSRSTQYHHKVQHKIFLGCSSDADADVGDEGLGGTYPGDNTQIAAAAKLVTNHGCCCGRGCSPRLGPAIGRPGARLADLAPAAAACSCSGASNCRRLRPGETPAATDVMTGRDGDVDSWGLRGKPRSGSAAAIMQF